jgi:hypothetical protein
MLNRHKVILCEICKCPIIEGQAYASVYGGDGKQHHAHLIHGEEWCFETWRNKVLNMKK